MEIYETECGDFSSDFDDRIDSEVEVLSFENEDNVSYKAEDDFYRQIEDY